MARSRCNHEDTGRSIRLGRPDRSTRTNVPDNDIDAQCDRARRDRGGFVALTHVVLVDDA